MSFLSRLVGSFSSQSSSILAQDVNLEEILVKPNLNLTDQEVATLRKMQTGSVKETMDFLSNLRLAESINLSPTISGSRKHPAYRVNQS